MFKSGYFKKVKIGKDYIKSNNFIDTNNRLKYPLDNIADCKGMKYTLQLSTYAYIMELWGYKLIPNGLSICHLRPDMPPKFINCSYLKQEIQTLFLHHYKKNVLFLKDPKQIFGIK
jgi:hypothetical protein